MAKRSDIEWKLSQMFMTGIPGIEIEKPLQEFLQDYRPSGVLYFSENYESPALLNEFSAAIQGTADELPFFISVDHEGGKVQRFKKPFTSFPEPWQLGLCDSPKLAFKVAEVMAKELLAVGVNLDFHPLCDILSRPNNPIIGHRAFGTDSETVEKMASAMVRGFIAGGMVSSCKHFPGHGDTILDSHKALPKVNQTWEELLKREIQPFLKCIKSRVDMVMTAHILNPQLDPDFPATLSKNTLKKLRDELRFGRIVITDDMQMDAITKHYDQEDALIKAIDAGADILLYRDMEAGRMAMDLAFKALATGRIAKERVEESFGRISEVKNRVLKRLRPAPMDKLNSIIGCEEHKKILEELNELMIKTK